MIDDELIKGVQRVKDRMESGVPGTIFEALNSKWGLFKRLTDEDLVCFDLGTFGQYNAYDAWFVESVLGDDEVAEVMLNMPWGHPEIMMTTCMFLMEELEEDLEQAVKAVQTNQSCFIGSVLCGTDGFIRMRKRSVK